jgi:hypothetical protein
MSDYTTVEQVHLAILQDAADEANRRWSQMFDVDVAPTYIPAGQRFNAEARARRGKSWASGEVFRADPIQSTKGGLCLTVNEAVTMTMTVDDIQLLHRVGRESMHWSLIKNQEKFVGLILGEARHGRDYFARYPNNITGQFRLF